MSTYDPRHREPDDRYSLVTRSIRNEMACGTIREDWEVNHGRLDPIIKSRKLSEGSLTYSINVMWVLPYHPSSSLLTRSLITILL